MRTKMTVKLALFVGIIGVAATCLAAEQKTPAKNESSAAAAGHAVVNQAYLGIGVESLPMAFGSQMPGLLSDGEGVLVAAVVKGSPADKAGLKPNDIVVKYDDQRLFSPEQVVKLVRHDKPDRPVKLGVIHDGKSEELTVTLGERPAAAMDSPGPRLTPRTLAMPGEHPLTAEEEEARWKTFDALTLTRTGKDQFKAEVKYRDDAGKLQSCTYQGTLPEIRKEIKGQKDLPANERDTVLRAISASNNPRESAFPFVRLVPDNNGVQWDFIEPAGPMTP